MHAHLNSHVTFLPPTCNSEAALLIFFSNIGCHGQDDHCETTAILSKLRGYLVESCHHFTNYKLVYWFCTLVQAMYVTSGCGSLTGTSCVLCGRMSSRRRGQLAHPMTHGYAWTTRQVKCTVATVHAKRVWVRSAVMLLHFCSV